jgi:hypothetical protein
MRLIFLFSLIFFLSCNEQQEKSPGPVQKADTNNRKRPDNISNSYTPVDISPMDMSYFPADYPKLKMAKRSDIVPLARVIYSRPHLQGRHIFHEVLKYGQPWRLGANESTELELFKDAAIQGKKIPAGRYVLYCIPSEENWAIIFNSNIDSWGLEPDSTQDVARFNVPVKKINSSLEYFTMVFEKTTSGADLLMAWDNVEVRLPFQF